jgi:hypothetical protein
LVYPSSFDRLNEDVDRVTAPIIDTADALACPEIEYRIPREAGMSKDKKSKDQPAEVAAPAQIPTPEPNAPIQTKEDGKGQPNYGSTKTLK